ncbi:T9SS type A sorting domain-containing protein [Oscillatoria amoena NRMC-F 0135]|nr:T9SS type A sorting domain-containing protein [Oscillatoria amoena NRMC-F 0135]
MKKTLLLTLLTSCTLGLFGQTLVAHYPFNGNANDSSGNGINASINKGIPTSDRLGNPNSAYKFGGDSNTYIQIPHDNKLNLSGSKSIALWVKVDTIPNQQFPSLLLKEGTADFYPTFAMQLNHDNGYALKDRYKVGFFFGNGLTNKLLSAQASYLDTTYKGKWMHIAATYSTTTGYQMIYLNGTLNDSAYVGSYTSATSNSFLQIGRGTSYGNFSNNYFKGSLDDIRIYDGALNASQVSDIYSSMTSTNAAETLTASDFVMYPNPTNTTVYFSNLTEVTEVLVYDINGRLCFNGEVAPQDNSFDVSAFSNGVYTVVATSASSTTTQKLIVQR